jgi:hypothetical protein
MDEARFQLIKTLGFALSLAFMFLVQSLAPYRRARRLVTGNWRQSVPIAIINTVVMSLVCGSCLCAVARYTETRGLGAREPSRPLAGTVEVSPPPDLNSFSRPWDCAALPSLPS